MDNLIYSPFVEITNHVSWKSVTGFKGEVYYMTEDERFYISRPIHSKRGWELSKRNIIDGIVVYSFLKAFSSLKTAKNYVANNLY